MKPCLLAIIRNREKLRYAGSARQTPTRSMSGPLAILLSAGLLLSLLGCGTPAPAPVSSREESGASISSSARHYRVQSGDTLYSIAWRAGLDYRQLASWNGIRAPYTIFPGQLLSLKAPARNKPTQRSAGATKAKTAVAKSDPKPKASAGSKTRTSQAKKSSAAADAAQKRLSWRWPTEGRVVQTFSHDDRSRQGIEIAGRLGQPVLATESGKIVYSGSGLIGYGQLIIIKHNKNYLSAYGHNRKILVKEGDEVTKGQRIAEMGRPPDGQPLLHFEIRRKGTPVNPMLLLPGKG